MTREQAITRYLTRRKISSSALIEAPNRSMPISARIEVWTAALACFQEAAPQYEPSW
jgi:hypothetical protein